MTDSAAVAGSTPVTLAEHSKAELAREAPAVRMAGVQFDRVLLPDIVADCALSSV